MLSLSFADFNLVESAFWVFCSLVSLSALRFRLVSPPLWYLLAFDFLLFGISDFIEAYYPVSFLERGGEELFAWKITCILGFVACLIWYLIQRVQKR